MNRRSLLLSALCAPFAAVLGKAESGFDPKRIKTWPIDPRDEPKVPVHTSGYLEADFNQSETTLWTITTGEPDCAFEWKYNKFLWTDETVNANRVQRFSP